jgi:outer membrane lipoprotein-sorting protein
MNFHVTARCFVALLLLPLPAKAQENRYDLLGRMLNPFVNVFAQDSKSPNRAFSFNLKLEQMTDLPESFVGSQVEVAVEFPDKIRFHAPILGEDVTLCRHGDAVWAYPGSKVDFLLKTLVAKKKPSKHETKYRLEPFSLPVPEKQLVFLPALFQLTDVGSEPIDGVNCRVLDVYLMPQLARAVKAQDWGARVWVQADAKPVRISVAKPGWMAVVHFDQVQFAPKLPDSTWEPTPEQSADVLKLDAEGYQHLLNALVK